MADATKTVAILFEGDTSSAEASVGRLNRALGEVLEAEQRLNPVSADTAQTIDRVGQESAQAAAEVDKLEQSTRRTKDASELLTDALKAFIASAITKAFIDANVSAEQFRLTMEQVTGSTAGATKEFDYIREVADRMGLNVQSAAESYARLAAATKNTVLEGDGARVIFEAIAGSMSRLGSSSADVDAALRQVVQGISKGKFELEDLKSIAERIPGFFDQFARSLGITTDELFNLIRQGQIGTPELLKFANTLNETLGSASFDSYTANLNRLKNSITEAFVIIGDSGAWSVFVKGLQAGTTAIVGTVSSMQLLYDLAKILVDQTRSLSLFSGETGEKMQAAFDKAANAMRPASDALLGLSDNTKQAGFNAVEAGQKIEESMTGAGTAAKQTGEQILTAFDKLLRGAETSEQLAKATTDLILAFAAGNIPAEAFYSRLDDIQKKQLQLDGAMGGATTRALEQEAAFKKTAEATAKAQDAAQKYAIEMEKIASNERIKIIEAQIKLDIAQVEADAKVAVAAFESIDNTITSTGETLSNLLGLLAGGTKDWESWRRLTSEIEKESARRDEALQTQNKLLEAQMEYLRARTAALQQGEAVIKVDGAGLQPHLEAFMWEILRTIQLRVNAQGLEMLVGV